MTRAYLYKEVAEKITSLVDNGTFRPGDRLPSIRELSRQSKVSINTVKVAYGHLEDRSVIEARPQSGYYVCPRLLKSPREPEICHERISPLEISTGGMVVRIMKDIMNPDKIQFGAAIPDSALVPADKLSRIIASESRRYRYESASYAIPPGNMRLRKQIARWMIKAGCTLSPEEILITSGASEAFFLALQTICKAGDTVAIGTPIYFNFVQMFKMLNLKIIEIPNSPTEGLHLESLEHALKHNRISCCVVVSNFDNPLGSTMSDERKRMLVTLLERADVPLIEDDINGDLSYSDERPSVAKAWDRSKNVLLCSSFSKTLAPGYRVGWIAPGKYMEKLLHRKLVTNIASPSPTQIAMAEFLENGGYAYHLRSIRKTYAAKIGRMIDGIGHAFPPGTRVTRPKGGFVVWVELPEGIDTVAMYARAEEKNITIAPGRLFSITNQYTNCMRLNGAVWSEKNRWAVDELGRIAADLQV